jgi:hypothetical protein
VFRGSVFGKSPGCSTRQGFRHGVLRPVEYQDVSHVAVAIGNSNFRVFHMHVRLVYICLPALKFSSRLNSKECRLAVSEVQFILPEL